MPPRATRNRVPGIEEFAELVAARLLAMTRPDAEHLTTEGLAKRLNLSVRTVEDWRLDRKGPPYLDDPVRYPLAWVEEWELSHRVDPANA